jgi:hypothetical protein
LDPEKSAVSTDWIIPFRAALLSGIAIVDDPLVRVRLHPGSKSNRFLRSPDSLVDQESNFANSTIQYLYMLETLGEAEAKGLIAADASHALRQHLFKSIMRSAREWRLHRNRLLAQGRRARWPR